MSKVTLNGYVVADDDKWLYDYFGIGCFSPLKVRQAIENNPEAEELELEINSGGGSVFAGFEMYSLLRAAKCKTVAVVQSLAASAASTVMLGCDCILLSPVAQVMIHLPSARTEGDRRDHKQSIRLLDSITESILNGYELRCSGKTSRSHLANLMEHESWLTAQEAIKLGLADDILYQAGETPLLPNDVVNAVGGSIRALMGHSAVMPAPAQLLEQYQRMVADGAKPVEGHTVQNVQNNWQERARLDMEYKRYI